MTVIINDTSDDCRQWLGDHTADFDLDLIVRTTPSSWASFQVVADRLRGGPAVITTIDAVLPVWRFLCIPCKAAARLARRRGRAWSHPIMSMMKTPYGPRWMPLTVGFGSSEATMALM